MKEVERSKQASSQDRAQAASIHKDLSAAAEYAPWWVRILSTLCLGAGTMVGYKRIVPARSASALDART
jgi:PiT family inorganic phosphate transporter